VLGRVQQLLDRPDASTQELLQGMKAALKAWDKTRQATMEAAGRPSAISEERRFVKVPDESVRQVARQLMQRGPASGEEGGAA